MFTVITAPGIGEPLSPEGAPLGMLENFTRHLPDTLFTAQQFNYRNQYGPSPQLDGTAYDENLADAVPALDGKVRVAATAGPVMLAGYSAGAQVVSEYLGDIADGVYPLPPNLVGAVLVANPLTSKLGGWTRPALLPPIIPERRLYGVAGEHRTFPEGLAYFALGNRNDIICASEENSPIRGFSNISKSFSFTNPQRWIAEYIKAAREGKNQNWFNPAAFLAWSRALDGALGYLDGSEHVQWYLQENRLAILAEEVTAFAEEYQP